MLTAASRGSQQMAMTGPTSQNQPVRHGSKSSYFSIESLNKIEHFWSPASPGPIWSEMGRFGRPPNRSSFLLTPLFKSSICCPRQARGQFGPKWQVRAGSKLKQFSIDFLIQIEHFWSPASPGSIWYEMARFGRAPNRSNFILTPLFKWSIFGPRQARGRFGPKRPGSGCRVAATE